MSVVGVKAAIDFWPVARVDVDFSAPQYSISE
jgi:hypothetical protein